MTDAPNVPIAKALFVRLIAQDGKANEVEQFMRYGLPAVLEEPDTTSWFSARFGQQDFGIFDTLPSVEGHMAHLAGKVGSAPVARTPDLLSDTPRIEHADVLAYKLPQACGQVSK